MDHEINRTDRELIRADFDRIAQLPGGRGDDWLLTFLPSKMSRALEIGCGKGLFTVELARRAAQVTAIDLSPKMIEAARSRVPPHVELLLGDVTEHSFAEGAFDCAVSIATLHHLPLAEMLRKMARTLAPGGVLVVHDLLDSSGLVGRLASRLASLVRKRATGEAAAAWAAHAEHDEFLKWSEVKSIVRAELPGARLRRHWKWRYTAVWVK
jgi:2-polyprenyl-3-methyl-5-hydroxy-6-metoxy-1,4-benzoquinol methylase